MKTHLKWGIEEMSGHIYVGPLRPNSTKLHEIAFMVDIHGHTENSKSDHRKECRMIVRAVNQYNRQRSIP